MPIYATVSEPVSFSCGEIITDGSLSIFPDWILFWLSQHPTWREYRTWPHDFCLLCSLVVIQRNAGEARKVEVTTRNYGLIVPGLALGGENDKEETSRKTTYLPSLAVTYSIWYKRCYMTVSRIEVRKGHSHSGESLRIRYILTLDQEFVSLA